MSQSLRRLWQVLHTLVGGGRHWLSTPLTTPSTSDRTDHPDGGRQSGDESVTSPTQPGRSEATSRRARQPRPDGDHPGPERDGHESDDAERDGHESDGTERDGHESDGAERDGHESDVDGAESVASDQTPEQQILAALADNGGRMKQSALHEATSMSQSSVSRRLMGMEDRGDVTRYEIGRGKVVFLPSEEPEAFASPLEGSERQARTAP